MKTTTEAILSQLKKDELETLLNVTDETVAKNISNHKTFSIVDLWRVQKKYRSSTSLRRHL